MRSVAGPRRGALALDLCCLALAVAALVDAAVRGAAWVLGLSAGAMAYFATHAWMLLRRSRL
jgi:hypothetical protein